MSKYDKFYNYLAELQQSHVRLLDLLQEKLAAIDNFNINKLDEIIKEEQVFVLVSKGFDSTISKFRSDLSLEGDKLSSIIEELPDEEKQRFRDLFKQLKTSLNETQALNQKCQELLEERLYVLNKSLRKLDKTAGSSYGNTVAGGTSGSNPHFLTKSV